jgi:hypothetical protein
MHAAEIICYRTMSGMSMMEQHNENVNLKEMNMQSKYERLFIYHKRKVTNIDLQTYIHTTNGNTLKHLSVPKFIKIYFVVDYICQIMSKIQTNKISAKIKFMMHYQCT